MHKTISREVVYRKLPLGQIHPDVRNGVVDVGEIQGYPFIKSIVKVLGPTSKCVGENVGHLIAVMWVLCKLAPSTRYIRTRSFTLPQVLFRCAGTQLTEPVIRIHRPNATTYWIKLVRGKIARANSKGPNKQLINRGNLVI